MDNPERLATLGTQHTGRWQTAQKHNTDNYKDEQDVFKPAEDEKEYRVNTNDNCLYVRLSLGVC
jgi:hypothetical protein